MLSFSGIGKRPSSKTYTLFSFSFNPVKNWVEESPPLKVVMEITNRNRGYYGVETKVKDREDYVGITGKDRVLEK
jgi:hypothetical protein